MRLRTIVWLVLGLILIDCASKSSQYQQAIIHQKEAAPTPPINTTYALTIDAERIAMTKAYFEAHNNALFRAMPAANDIDSIRFEPRLVVVHFTAIETLEKTTAYFQPNTIASNRGIVAASGALNVGIQYIVDRDGTIYSSYPDNVMSRHVIGLNHVAIGIENIGNADLGTPETGDTVPLTYAQLEANQALIAHLANKYPTINFVIGHYEYRDLEDPTHPAHALFAEDQAEYRTDKVDPGQQFMRILRKRLNQSHD